MNRKLVISIISFIIMSSAGSALWYDGDHTFDVPDSVTYGSDLTFDVTCDPETGICGGASGSSRDIRITTCRQRDVSIKLDPKPEGAMDVDSFEGSRISQIPHEINCGLGTHTAQLLDSTDKTVIKEKTFEVTSYNMGSPPNKANYLLLAIDDSPTEIIGYNPDPPSLNHFFLTNDAGDGSNYPKPPEGAYLLFDYFDDNAFTEIFENYKYGAFEPNYGDVLEKEDSNLAAITAQDQKYTGDGGGNGNWWKGTFGTGDPSNLWDYVATQDFDDSMDLRFRFNGCRVGRPGPVENNYDDCTPIHEKDGSFNPEGEIIVANDMDASAYTNGFDSNGVTDNSQVVSDSKTNFYICRGNYKGSNLDSSKVVKVQQNSAPEYEYYRCNMDNEWVQGACPPGQRLDVVGGVAQCEPIDEVNIRATYFNVSNVSFNAPSQGYTTGFKINRSELDKYIDVTDTPATVDAECWMGEDNDRPSNSDGSVTFTAEDSGSGDLWMLEKVPGRSSAENSTYSCIWGLRNTQADSDENIYDTANNNPINSRDGGKIDIKFEDIQSQAASSSTSEIGRWVWDFYEKPEDGGFDYRSVVNDQYHFMFDNEFPYCEGTSFWSSVGPSDRSFQAGTPEQLSNINCSGGDGGGSSSYPDYADTPDAVTSGPSEVEVGNSIQFDGSGSSDTDGTIESYSWEVRDGSGNTVASGSGSDFRFTPSTSGTYTLQLNVTDNYGAIGTTTDTFEVKDNVNTGDEFTVGYVPAYISSTEASNGEWQNLVDTAHNSLKNNLKMDGSKLAKLKLDPSELNFNGCSPRKDCLNQLESQCPGDCPVDADDYDKLHLICDNSDPFDGENGPCNSGGGIANMQGTYGVTVFNGDSGDLGDTVPHEIGHNLGLEHVWNPDDMLADGYSVGETTSDTWDVVIDQCITIPSQYKDPRDGTPFEIKEIHEERRWGNHNSDWKNLEDNRESTPASMDRVNYIMSYCGPEEGFGPEAENYMENNQLSGYQ